MSSSNPNTEIARRQTELYNELSQMQSMTFNVDALLDALQAFYEECYKLEKKQPSVQSFLQRYKLWIEKLSSLRISQKDFKVIKILGRGAFGEVALCSCKFDDQYYAVKKLKKSEMLQRDEAFYMEERELLGLSKSEWIASLQYAFQDEEYLYLVLEYCAGGNLLNLLYKQNAFDEATARFYIAEAVLGVQEIHEMGFVYRDLKPDNMLLTKDGHLKLADFGSCIRVDENGFVPSKIAVGTPYYIAPEALRAQEGREKCGKESDWWSLGVVLYELLVGDPPFYSESMKETYGMIMNYKTSLTFPDDVELSTEVVDLIKKLICSKEDRLGLEEIKRHPFFKDVDWSHIRSKTPPFVPELRGPDDTSNFDDEFDTVETTSSLKKNKPNKEFLGESLAFIGYTFTKNGVRLSMSGNTDSATQIDLLNERRRSVNDTEVKKHQQEIEKWQNKFNQEKERATQIEELRDTLAQELEKKERLLASETASRKTAENHSSDLEKTIKMVQLEVDELQRKLSLETKEKHVMDERVRDLEDELHNAIKAKDELLASFSASNVDKDSWSKEINSLKRKLEEETTHAAALERDIVDLTSKKQQLEAQLTTLTAELQSEKEARISLDAHVRDLKRSIAEASIKESKLSSLAEKREQEISELKTELQALKENLEKELKSKASTLQIKTELENKKTMLELEIEQLNDRLHREEKKTQLMAQKAKEFEDALSLKRAETDNSASLIALAAELENAKISVQIERQSKEVLEQKIAELAKEKAAISLQMSSLEGSLAEETAKHSTDETKIHKLQKLLEKKMEDEIESDEIKRELEQKIRILKTELEALEDNIDQEMNAREKLETQQSILEKAREESEAKAASLLKKYHEESEQRQHISAEFEESQRQLLKEKQTTARLQTELDTLTAAKENIIREMDRTKKRLEETTQTKKEQDDQLAELRKQQAVLGLELAQMEKKYLSEQEQKTELLEKNQQLTMESTKTLTQITELTETFEKLQGEKYILEQEIQTISGKLTIEQESKKDLEKAYEDLKKVQENTQLKLEATIKKLESSLQPLNELQVKKDHRKLKEEYTALQMRYEGADSERKRLEALVLDYKAKLDNINNTNGGSSSASSGTDSMARRNSLTGLSRASSTKSIKSDFVKSDSNNEISNMAKEESSLFSFMRRRSTRRDKPRPTSIVINKLPTSTEFHITAHGFEGYLKIPKEKGLRMGWNKKFIVCRDSKLMMFDDKNKSFSTDTGVILADVKGDLFVVRDPTPEIASLVNPKEVSAMFLIYVKVASQSGPKTTAALPSAATTPTTTPPLDLAKIAAKIKSLEKELQVEERLYKGAMTMLPLATGSQKKQAQKQVEGSQVRLEQLRKELTKYKEMEEHALSTANNAPASTPTSPSVTTSADDSARQKLLKKIESLQKAITTEEKIKSGHQTLLEIAGNDKQRQTAQEQLDATNKKLLQLSTDLKQWQDMLQKGTYTDESVRASGLSSHHKDLLLEETFHEFNGHKYKMEKFNYPVHCQICSQLMYGTANQGFECTVCKYIVHSSCYTTGGASCTDVQSLMDAKPLIFMAADESDRDRWVNNLMSLRESLTQSPTSP